MSAENEERSNGKLGPSRIHYSDAVLGEWELPTIGDICPSNEKHPTWGSNVNNPQWVSNGNHPRWISNGNHPRWLEWQSSAMDFQWEWSAMKIEWESSAVGNYRSLHLGSMRGERAKKRQTISRCEITKKVEFWHELCASSVKNAQGFQSQCLLANGRIEKSFGSRKCDGRRTGGRTDGPVTGMEDTPDRGL